MSMTDKEALESARILYEFYKDTPAKAQKIIDAFPELAESEEDEKKLNKDEIMISITELEDFIETELHKDEFIRRWPQYEFHVPDHREGDEYSSGVAVGVGRAINALKNFITNKIAEHDSK